VGPGIAQLHRFATFETYFTIDSGVVFSQQGCDPILIYKFKSMLQKQITQFVLNCKHLNTGLKTEWTENLHRIFGSEIHKNT
jgi:hypothetical protein